MSLLHGRKVSSSSFGEMKKKKKKLFTEILHCKCLHVTFLEKWERLRALKLWNYETHPVPHDVDKGS